MSTKEPFLGRWSRRKREESEADRDAVASGGDETAPTDAAEDEAEDAANANQKMLDELPEIDSLEKDSDFTVFMKVGVPEALRNRALRKLWLSDPVLANLDGLNDYDEDYGAILREGAAYMQRLVDAGEPMTRPDALHEPLEETEAEEVDDTETALDTADSTPPADATAPDASTPTDDAKSQDSA